jgi:peroxiredoxin
MKAIAVLAALLLTAAAQAQTVHLRPVSSGASNRAGGPPQPLQLSFVPPDTLKKAPKDLVSPLYGTLPFGPKEKPLTITIILDDPPGKPSRLLVDANGNGDLTDDPAPEWTKRPYKANSGQEFRKDDGGALIALHYGSETVPVRLGLFRYDSADLERALYKDTLFYYADYAREGELPLGGKTYSVLLADTLARGDFRIKPAGSLSGVLLMIDVNGNGVFDRQGEIYDAAKPFNIKGVTYEIKDISASGDTLTVGRSSRAVPEIPAPPDLRPGKPSLPFEAKTLDGQTVKFPADYKGKLVMLFFWASWCGDCTLELPNVVQAYQQFHPQGVEWLGVSLDEANAAAQLAAFTKENRMPWPQVYDGKKWKAAIAQLYFVQTIPSGYLIDGDTGEILAGGDDVLGSKLMETLQKAVTRRSEKASGK